MPVAITTAVVRRAVMVVAAGSALVLAGGVGAAASAASTPPLVRIVKASEGAYNLKLSADGQYAVFETAKRLTSADTNNYTDVYLRNLQTGATTLVSVGRSGPGNADSSGGPAISADDRHVAFVSAASNLVQGDTNGQPDVFVRDVTAGTTSLVSVHLAGATGRNGPGGSAGPVISADGRYVAFSSDASDLVPNDPHQPNFDVFLRDLSTGTTTQVTTTGAYGMWRYGWTGSRASAITPDGRYVLFNSNASGLVPGGYGGGVQDAYVWEQGPSTPKLVSLGTDGRSSRTGRSDAGGSVGTAISADGRYVAFDSDAVNMVANDTNNLSDVFVRDLLANPNTTALVATGRGGSPPSDSASYSSSMSADGRQVVFSSLSQLLGPTVPRAGVQHTYRRDLQGGATSLVDVSAAGTVGNAGTSYPALSADGHSVAFESAATNLLPSSRPGDWLVYRS